jgi:hypothetical protein
MGAAMAVKAWSVAQMSRDFLMEGIFDQITSDDER